MLTIPWWCPKPSGPSSASGSKPRPLSSIEQDEVVAFGAQRERGLGRAGVAGDVGQGLAGDEQDVRPAVRRHRAEQAGAALEVDVEVDHRVDAQLLGEPRERLDRVLLPGAARAAAARMYERMSRDHEVERVDGVVHALDGLGRPASSSTRSRTSSSDRPTP